MAGAKFYAIVEFPNEDNATAVVSSTWLTQNNTHCYWPRGQLCSITKLAKEHSLPNQFWHCYPCRVLKTTDSFSKATAACVRSEHQSNLDTTAAENNIEPIRKRKTRRSAIPKHARKPKLQLVKVKSEPSSSSGHSSVSESSPLKLPPVGLLHTTHQQATSRVYKAPDDLPLPSELRFPSDRIPISQVFGNVPPLPGVIDHSPPNEFSENFLQPPIPHCRSNQLNTKVSSPLSTENPSVEWNRGVTDTDFLRKPSEPSFELSTYRAAFSHPIATTPNSGRNQISQPLRTNEQSGFEKVVLEYLVKIQSNQREILRRLAEPKEDTLSESPQLPVELPIQSLDSLEGFITWLDNPANHKSMVNELSIIGGANIAGITQRVLASLISNRVAELMSLTGRGKKTKAGTKGTSLHLLIYGTVRTTKGGGSATNNEIDKAIQNWLKSAPDREGGSQYQRHKKIKACNEQGSEREHQPEPNADG
ncbi:unnamed protein product [Orchesella dallaii]|uniref:DUF4806 domain-containing protein n=1 Tax=Orchesella dallaii TaxID=48710 RepID=A0ABP1RDZ3_9HEXA